jgi:hypothetical protein
MVLVLADVGKDVVLPSNGTKGKFDLNNEFIFSPFDVVDVWLDGFVVPVAFLDVDTCRVICDVLIQESLVMDILKLAKVTAKLGWRLLNQSNNNIKFYLV